MPSMRVLRSGHRSLIAHKSSLEPGVENTRRFSLLSLFIVLLLAPIHDLFAFDDTPDIAGVYQTVHPDEKTGEVLIRFAPSEAASDPRGAARAVWDVSLWRYSEGVPRKIRDGLFDCYTKASIQRRGAGLYIVWHSPDAERKNENERWNEIMTITEGGDIELGGSENGSTGEHYTLKRIGGPDSISEAHGPLDLTGVYDYYHAATGRVLVAFTKSAEKIQRKTKPAIDAYEVRIVRDFGASRFAVEREGLYGGSRPLDEFTLVGMEKEGGDYYLVWQNPQRSKVVRRNRIVCRYENGDIGIGLEQGELKYIEDTRFRKIAGTEAIVGEVLDFIPSVGIYEVVLWPETTAELTALVRIAPTAVSLGSRRIFSIETVEQINGGYATRHRGFFKGDEYGFITFDGDGGACLIVFTDFETGREEKFEVLESKGEGSFTLGRIASRRSGQVSVIARFNKKAPFDGVVSTCDRTLNQPEPDKGQWTPEEKEAFNSVYSVLPTSFFTGPDVSIVRDEGLFVMGGGADQGALAELSTERREIRIKRFALAEGYPADPARTHTKYLERLLGRCYARLFYKRLDPKLKREWESFNKWETEFFSKKKPRNQNDEGFADSVGRLSPEEDFAAFAEDVFLSPSGKDPLSFVRFRLPDRYEFFRRLFPTLPAKPSFSAPNAGLLIESYRDWIDPDDVERVELVVTTPTTTAIESIAGHALLLIKRKSDYEDCSDSLVFGFVGEISRDSANGIKGLTYVYRGLTGYYRSLIQIETLSSLVRRATLLENRDVVRMKLKLSRSEIDALIRRLWVLDRTFTYRYYFFSGNCVSMLLDLLNTVFPEDGKVEIKDGIVAPMYAVSRLAFAGRIEEFSYPERWSILKTARYASSRNRETARRILDALETAKAREKRAGVSRYIGSIYDEVKKTIDVLFDQGKGRIAEDPLFRSPYIVATGPDRSAAYRRLAELCIELDSVRRGPPECMSDDEYMSFAELTLRFLFGAVERELYIAVPPDLKREHRKSDIAFVDTPEYVIERKLYKVRSRQENSPELQAVYNSISILRKSIAEFGAVDDFYTLGRTMSEERERQTAASRRNVVFAHGYYDKGLGLSWRFSDTSKEVGVEYTSALYRGEIGDQSLCALKRDMRLVLLDAGLGLYYDFSAGADFFDTGRVSIRSRAVAADFEKIITGENIDYDGFLNPGFGLTLLKSSGTLWDGEQLFPDRDSELSFLEARILLNIFEAQDFRHYLTIGTGSGLKRSIDEGGPSLNIEVPIFMETRIGLPGLAGNAAHIKSIWTVRFPFDEEPSSRLDTFIDADISFHSKKNTSLGVRASLAFDFGKFSKPIVVKNTEVNVSLVLKP